MRNKSWTKEEEDYLVKLSKEIMDDGGYYPPSIVTILFNDHFSRIKEGWEGRSHGAVQRRMKNLTREVQTTTQEIKVKEMKTDIINRGKPAHGNEVNSGRSWTPADDSYLVKNFTSNEEQQGEVAETLGRSRKACHSRLHRMKNNDMIGIYSTDKNLVGVQLSNKEQALVDGFKLPVTLLGFLTLWWRNRRKNKKLIKRLKLERRLERMR